MKTRLTKEYIYSQKGCYKQSKVDKLKCINNKTITLKQLFKELPIKDFTWWLARKCDLTLNEKRQLALHCAKQVLPIFEKRCPEDSRVCECIEATEGYLNGKATLGNLMEKHASASATYDTTYAAAAAEAASAAYKESIWLFVESIK